MDLNLAPLQAISRAAPWLSRTAFRCACYHRNLLAMTPEKRQAQIDKWTATMKGHWTVEGDELVNDGQGAYATTETDYRDFAKTGQTIGWFIFHAFRPEPF